MWSIAMRARSEVAHRLEVEHPPLERVLRGIFGAVRSRVAARLPENQPVAGGQRVAVDVPHLDVAADAVGEHEGRSAPVHLVVDPDLVAGPGERHGGILAAPGFLAPRFRT